MHDRDTVEEAPQQTLFQDHIVNFRNFGNSIISFYILTSIAEY